MQNTRSGPVDPPPDDEDDAPGGGRSLRLQVIALLALAVTPALVYAAVDGYAAYARALENASRGFLNTASISVQPAQDRLVRMTTMARLLGEIPAVRRFDASTCEAALPAIAAEGPDRTVVAVLDADGFARCASPPAPPGSRPVPDRLLQRLRAAAQSGPDDLLIDELPGGPDRPGRLVVAARPMRDGDALAGLVAVFLPLDSLNWRQDRGGQAPSWRALVDSQDGRLFMLPGAAELEDPSRLIPPARPADSAPGRPWRFYSAPSDAPGLLVAVTPLISERLSLVDAIPVAELEAQAFHSALPRMVAPLAVLAVALVAAYVAMDRLVLRHLLHLARITRAFGRGRLTVRPNLPPDAPSEIAELADDLAATADALQTRQKELEAAVKANRLLLMEVYHRVKNNLQMVGSFVSLQARRARDPASRGALEPIRARVHAMSLVHEMLYRSTDLETVSLDGLLAEVARSIVNAGAPPPTLTLDLDPRVETQERAIPLALFVNECVTNAVRHAAPSGRPEVRLALRALDDGGLELSVENDAPEPDEETSEEGLGSRLIVAFARQVRGELRTEREGGVYRVTLVAPPADERPARDDSSRVF